MDFRKFESRKNHSLPDCLRPEMHFWSRHTQPDPSSKYSGLIMYMVSFRFQWGQWQTYQCAKLQETQNCSPSLTVILFRVEKQEKADLETVFAFVIRWSIGNQRNKITSQEVHRSWALCSAWGSHRSRIPARCYPLCLQSWQKNFQLQEFSNFLWLFKCRKG